MSHRLFDLNDDLKRLRDAGYNLDIHGAALVVRDIPYVNDQHQVLHDGILITNLDLNGEVVNRPGDHTIYFVGQRPCSSDGRPLDVLRLTTTDVGFSDKLRANYHFSSKPLCGYYTDYFEKVNTYASILSGHAANIDPTATAKTYRVVEPEEDDSPFNYLDTASARAEINMITRKLAVEKVAIIGLGGTGSYVLDLLAKTPIKEIHIFDGDKFSSHNAFRAPGAASIDDLHKQCLKVDYFYEIYSQMHKGLVPHGENVDDSNVESLRDMSCVFLCIDSGNGKEYIVEKLEEFGITFIDTGMGLYVTSERLGGILQVVTSEEDCRKIARNRISFASGDKDNEYDKNIQIADLNALNATYAVIRWKKMRGFYFDHTRERFNCYTIGTGRLLNEDIHA